ncbi:MAG: TonB-dependent receptor [Pseudomonadota bacterium]|nr:TonB-dependent receptor [Pseudomonadota bacterium]
MKKLILLCSTAVVFPTAAFAQSTGSVDFEKEIIVTGTRVQSVGGVQAPDAAKSKAVLTQEIIARANPGQTILDTINLVPGVSFQNNDAYGSSGGTLTIRGFDSSRISLTFDGIPLNDSGNYAIYSNQQLDPELIEQVNVNLGSTDVDSPTASAVGGTVNYRTLTPTKEFSGRGAISLGQFDFRRFFGVVHTGEMGPFGTRAFFSASTAKNDNPFNNYGKVNKQQYNAKIYQALGAGTDFVSLSGNYNQNRNNFFGSVRLRNDLPTPLGFPSKASERKYDINFPCTVDVPQPGVADVPNTCGTEFDRRFNPSNTGNIRGASRFTLAEGLVFTVDPSFQYVKANGGGTVAGREFGFDINPTAGRANCSTTANSATVNCVGGFFTGSPFAGGVDLNGDGDLRDTVTVLAPSQTRTRRYVVISGIRYEINDNHTVRASYTFDRANHRQTGEVGLLKNNGKPTDVFAINDPVLAANGSTLQKRDRQSYAILNQIGAEYRGEFGPLTLNIGARLPFFKRDLENNSFTSSASGFLECSGGNEALDATIASFNPAFSAPQRRVFKYKKFLPNVGVIYDFTPRMSAYASYAKGLSVPGTDNLYNSFFFPTDNDRAKPNPETSDTGEGGLRYRSSKVQAQVSTYYTRYNDRLASAFDPELETTVFRNLGRVNKYGIDGSVSYAPFEALTLYAFGSINRSKIKDNLQTASATFDCGNASLDTPELRRIARRNCAFTAGKEEAGAPRYSFGGSAVAKLGDFDFGATAKRTGPRFIYDTNEPVQSGDVDVESGIKQLFPSKAAAYWLVNLDVRYNLRSLGPELDKTYVQFNVYNLFNATYVGGFGGGLNQSVSASSGFFGTAPFVQIGAPRTISGTLNIGF